MLLMKALTTGGVAVLSFHLSSNLKEKVFNSQYKVHSVHHSGDVKVTGPAGHKSTVPSSSAGAQPTFYSSYSPGSPIQGIVLPRTKRGLPILIILLNRCPLLEENT